jgi:tetratricopeptide (TPR) repeat protein
LKVALLTLALLVVTGVALSLSRDYFEKIDPSSYLSPIFSYIDFNAPYDSKVIFLGSSRFASCIKSDMFAQLMGVEGAKALNLAVEGGGTWEELLICRKYPGLLRSSPLVVIEIEPWMFNKNLINPALKKPEPFEPHFYIWATFQERVELADTKAKCLLMADYVWPFSERHSLMSWIALAQSTGKRAAPKLEIPVYHYQPRACQLLAKDPIYSAGHISQDHLNDFQFDYNKAEYLKRLILLAEKKARNIVLLQPPVRKEYLDTIYNNPTYLDTYIKVIRFIHGLENENVHSIIWETPRDCDLKDLVLIDYGHFNREGAYLFTQRLFSELKNMGLMEADDTLDPALDATPRENVQKLEDKLKADHHDYETLYSLGNLYRKTEMEKAIKFYEAALSVRPDSLNAMERLSVMYSSKGYYKQALMQLSHMKELQPGNANIYYNIACVMAKQNKMTESLGWIKAAMAKGFNSRSVLVTDKDLDNIKGSPDFKELLKRCL